MVGNVETWSSISNWVLLASLVTGAISTFGIVRTGNIKEARAKIEIARTQEVASMANQRAAELEVKAANLKIQLSWREISFDQAKSLIEDLSLHPGKVTVRFMSSDPESIALAIQFSNIFQAAHWTVGTSSEIAMNSLAMGLFVPESSHSETETIRAALLKAGITFSPQDIPVIGMTMGSLQSGDATIYVGVKPRPLFPQ